MNKKKNLTTEEIFALAVQNHQKNNLKVAENFYNEILKTNPNHFESIYYLGILLAQTKRFDLAKTLLHKAIKIKNNKETPNTIKSNFKGDRCSLKDIRPFEGLSFLLRGLIYSKRNCYKTTRKSCLIYRNKRFDFRIG